MNNFNNELKSLDQELNRYQKKIQKIKLLLAIKLIKRVRSGIPITDDKLFIGMPNMNSYLFKKWLNTYSLFSWAIFKSIKGFHNEMHEYALYIKFYEDKKLNN